MSETKYLHICDNCGKEHYISSSQRGRILRGKQEKCFCSKECASLNQSFRILLNCEYCGKEIYRTKSQIEKSKNHFCSNVCADKFRSESKRIDVKCEICGKIFNKRKSQSQRFCSIECQGKWQSTQTGLLNPKYQRQTITCDWCGQKFDEKQYKLNDFDNHFCSAKCRREWYAKVYSQTDEHKEFSRKIMMDLIKSGAICNVDSKPQIILNKILLENNISYERERVNDFCSYDNYLIDNNLIIEVQGDYWHCNPLKYQDFIYKHQANRIKCDKAKHTYTLKQYHIEILYLWECDLVNRPHLCEKLIKEYVGNAGVLPNYHSLNYHLENDNLILNNYLVVPYQDMDFHKYKNKIRERAS